jgi:hypothetical protein
MASKRNRFLKCFFASFALGASLIGCSKSADEVDKGWSPAIAISSSTAGFGGAPRLHKYEDTLVGIQVLHGGAAQILMLSQRTGAWSATNISGPPNDDGWLGLWGAAGIEPQTGRIVLPGGYAENERLLMKAFFGKLTEYGSLRETIGRTWFTDKKALLGDTSTNVTLNHPVGPSRGHNRSGAIMAKAMVSSAETVIPFTFEAVTYFETPGRYRGKTYVRKGVEGGPFANGVLVSPDLGKTWRLEMVSNQRGRVPALCQTTGYLYYFAGPYPLWFSRKAANAETWETPRQITKTSHGFDAFYGVAGDGDTARICWMDRRHNKWRFSFDEPAPVNSDIYYRRRKDGAAGWDKEVWLSKGLMYCYAPTIAAEGDHVVVVWAGIRKAGRWHGGYGPNDIFYVTSKDAGKTWARPMRVTDGAKDGSTAGMPQIALLNGVIHLVYIQGKPQPRAELAPGLTKLGMDPWPIFYQRRDFPK